MGKYKPATFQPTVRPDWAGILSYMTDSEKSKILEAILKFPSMEIDSAFYNQTIKPDLTLQYETFKQVCLAKQRGVNNRWKIQKSQDSAEKKDKISIPDVSDINNLSIRKDIDSEGKGEREEEDKGESKVKKRGTGGKRFSPPSAKEVADYCQENKIKVDPETFIDYYATKGWLVGKSPMKDWRAAVRYWNRKNNETSLQKERDYSIPISLLKAKPEIISEEEKLKDKQDFNDLIGRIKEFSDEV